MAKLRFQVLGPLRVWRGGEEVEVGPAMQRAVLGMLLLSAGRPVPRTEIINALWGDDPPASCVNVVQTYVKRLRSRLEPDPAQRFARLATTPTGYLFSARPDELDLLRFREHAARATGGPERVVDEGLAALACWQGGCLADFDRDLPGVRAVEAERTALLLTCSGAALECGRSAQVLPALRTAAAGEPLHEALHAELMLTLASAGTQAEAVAVYHAMRARLDEELGVDPGPLLREAFTRVLRQDLPAVRARVPAQLPPAVARFVGRDELCELLLKEESRVSAIAGRGGVGKSALAVHVAHRLAERYPDGQLYATLRGADPAQVAAGFLRALGVEGPAVPAGLEEVSGLLRSRLAGRRVLMVLDDARSEAQVRHLLPGSPTCRVLVTSRTVLGGLDGARLLDLDIFEPDQAVELLATIAGGERVAAEPEAARELAGLCGHLPLAVRIAAAKLVARPRWSLAHLAVRLADRRRRLDELAIGDLEVRASLDLSYRDLPAKAQQLLRLLSLPRVGDFPGWIASALLDAEADAQVEALVDARLLDESGLDATGHMRYRLHDLVRLFAEERAAEEPRQVREAALARAFGGWLALAETAQEVTPYRSIWPARGTTRRYGWTGMERLVADPNAWYLAERANLVAVGKQACAEGLDEFAWELAAESMKFWSREGDFDSGRMAHLAALELCRRTGNLRGQAVMLRDLAESAMVDGRCRLARGFVEESVRLFQRLDEPAPLVEALQQQAQVHLHDGRGQEALAAMGEALRLAVEKGMREVEETLMRDLSLAHYLQGDLDRALADLRRGTPRGARAVNVQRRLGRILRERGDYVRSGAVLSEALETVRALGDRLRESALLYEIGELYADEGLPEAADMGRRALAIAREFDLSYLKAAPLRLLSRLAREAGDVSRALALAREAVQHARSCGAAHELAAVLTEAGRAQEASGDRAAAVLSWKEAVELYGGLGNAPRIAGLETLLLRSLAAERVLPSWSR
ncbi:BTAD domain-containing putative transcriptional regulator [Nonomuraea sp. NPDC050556]|uniref:AfsR/SARP family transcriptional regulator n=1 Tax=Nonomuraea sp. NPDC050556 TaxID=3364369 RepID=UPI0037B9E370